MQFGVAARHDHEEARDLLPRGLAPEQQHPFSGGIELVERHLQQPPLQLRGAGHQPFELRPLKDDSCSIGIGFDRDINDAVIQPDGKVVVWGSFGLYKGINQKKLARLLPNGDLDSSFNTGTSFPNGTSSLDPQLPQKIEIDSNGSLIIIGTFTSYNESPKFVFVKLNSDGSIDSNCNFTTNNNYLYSIAVGYDDNIIVGGIRKIYRILSNGNQDVTLSYVTGYNSRIYDTQSRPNLDL